MENVLIIATSLNEDSKSQILAQKFTTHLREQSVPYELADLRQLNLPFAGKKDSWEGAEIVALREKIVASSHVIFSVPIYCYDVNAAAKNVIELAGGCFTKKVVGFMCTAGGHNSYMSVMGLANHLMMDFRSVIVPRFVYAVTSDWIDGETLTPEIEGRLQLLLEDMKSIRVNSADGGELETDNYETLCFYVFFAVSVSEAEIYNTGYGDFRPKHKLSKIAAIILALTGLVFTGILVAGALQTIEITLVEYHGLNLETLPEESLPLKGQ